MKRTIRMSSIGDLEYKKKPEDPASASSTPPRPSSPIVEAEVTVAPPTTLPADKETEKDESGITENKEKDPVYATVNKKQKVEEQEEENKEGDEQKSEEMVREEESKEEKKEDENDSSKVDFDLPELPTHTKKLEHVTKGRPRPTKRGGPRKPIKNTIDTDAGVDDFFTASVQSTDFDKVPTLTEEQKQAETENTKKTPKRPTGGVGMLGMPKLTPEMLKKKIKPSEQDKECEPDSPTKKTDERLEEKNGHDNQQDAPEEEVKSPEPAVKRRPPGAMGLPGMGMGFGSNILGEMKLKKLNKSKSPEPGNHDKTDENKNSTSHPALPFGPGMLKKTSHPVTSPTSEKPETNNNNNNNNNNLLRSPPNRWKSRSFERPEKPNISVKTKTPLMPPKPSPPPTSVKPSSFKDKGNPPALPTKPKPAALRPEFIDPKHVPSSVQLRAASWGKKKSEDSKEDNKK